MFHDLITNFGNKLASHVSLFPMHSLSFGFHIPEIHERSSVARELPANCSQSEILEEVAGIAACARVLAGGSERIVEASFAY